MKPNKFIFDPLSTTRKTHWDFEKKKVHSPPRGKKNRGRDIKYEKGLHRRWGRKEEVERKKKQEHQKDVEPLHMKGPGAL